MAERTLLTGYNVLDFTHALVGPTPMQLMKGTLDAPRIVLLVRSCKLALAVLNEM